MESQATYHQLLDALAWQVELGVDCAMAETPVNRYELPATETRSPAPMPAAAGADPARPGASPARAAAPVKQPEVDTVGIARAAASAAADLDALKAAMTAYDHCELKRGARNLVFSDGLPAARVMIVGEAPGRDEDREGRPFVGPAGQMLDRMFDAIGLGRANEAAPLYITNVMPWRPPQNRDPKPEEMAMMLPFLERHVALVDPDLIVLMGNIACVAGLGKRGITRLRGQWGQAFGKPALPMFHPAYLLRTPAAKREAWADLLSLQARLEGLG
ncbi:uracil-DNA glycosylase [Rhodalgimonas zhirmunskyi]|uniref:Type-4 uracil-DNA glycosylase n=1 Tax=Rhodalgimonas zhirmunskyi TaxID=2964767 RepID=A0AAJ1U562_9RHOB|nr:uracil-DNA glycosylase [Rhodoalgimonas zhirmunskyi]MDQ2093826.1 uracil-DNA glycosylase [Rhodoalgimonas zhirmunskyi]